MFLCSNLFLSPSDRNASEKSSRLFEKCPTHSILCVNYRAAGNGNERSRRANGVAILVHKSLKRKSIELTVDPDWKFIAIEVVLKPKSLIVYLCYMSIFEHNIANKHYDHIKTSINIIDYWNWATLTWIKSHGKKTNLKTIKCQYCQQQVKRLISWEPMIFCCD